MDRAEQLAGALHVLMKVSQLAGSTGMCKSEDEAVCRGYMHRWR